MSYILLTSMHIYIRISAVPSAALEFQNHFMDKPPDQGIKTCVLKDCQKRPVRQLLLVTILLYILLCFDEWVLISLALITLSAYILTYCLGHRNFTPTVLILVLLLYHWYNWRYIISCLWYTVMVHSLRIQTCISICPHLPSYPGR